MARKQKSTISVNFKGVEGKGVRLKPGEYPSNLAEAELVKQKGKDDYIKWIFEANDDSDSPGAKIYLNTSLSKQALWNLRGLLEALGQEVPDDEMDIDLEELVGEEPGLLCIVEMEEYEGKDRPKMVDYAPLEEDTGKKKKKDKKKGKDALDKDEVEAIDDRDEMEELIKDHKLDIDADDFKKDSKLLAAIVDALEEAGAFEDDAKDDGKKKKKGGKAEKLSKLTQEEVNDMDEDELTEVNTKYDLDVELDDFKSLRKKAAAIIDALDNG